MSETHGIYQRIFDISMPRDWLDDSVNLFRQTRLEKGQVLMEGP